MKRTGVLRNVYDERTFNHMRGLGGRHRAAPTDFSRRVMRECAREGRRIGWTWALIGSALGVSATTARNYAVTR